MPWIGLDCIVFQQQLEAGQTALGKPTPPDEPPILKYVYQTGPLLRGSTTPNTYRAGPLIGGSVGPNTYRAGPLLSLRGLRSVGRYSAALLLPLRKP
jgi:hypothetical protein